MSRGPDGAGLTVLVLAKEPRAGHTKTRLIPAFGPDGAAMLAAAALADTLDAVRLADVARRVLVLDGMSESLPCNGFDVVPQVSGTHVERIIAGYETTSGAAVMIGMDTPQVAPCQFTLDLAAPVDAWLGAAEDGGWWALGLRHARRDARRVLSGVPMSTPNTGAQTRDRLLRAGLRLADLPHLRDVDEVADAHAVARSVPRTRFAAQLATLCSTARDLTPRPCPSP